MAGGQPRRVADSHRLFAAPLEEEDDPEGACDGERVHEQIEEDASAPEAAPATIPMSM